MKTSKTRNRQLADAIVFYLEQWIALVVGLACLAAFLFSAIAGHKEFPLQHLLPFSKDAAVSLGWFLTMAVGLLGVTLMRFAFYKPNQGQEIAAAPETAAARQIPKRLQLTLSSKGRG